MQPMRVVVGRSTSQNDEEGSGADSDARSFGGAFSSIHPMRSQICADVVSQVASRSHKGRKCPCRSTASGRGHSPGRVSAEEAAVPDLATVNDFL
jgi:hypothetical protein